LEKFDEKYDIVLLKLNSQKSPKKIKYCKLDFKTTLKQGDSMFFGGFPTCFCYGVTETPFAINTGMISSFPETIVGGERYEHIQINSINLGGNSGAPLFRKNRSSVVGIINGNMNWGRDDLVSQDNSGRQSVCSKILRPFLNNFLLVCTCSQNELIPISKRAWEFLFVA